MKCYDSICCFRSRNESQEKRVCWEITTDCNLKCPFCHRYDFLQVYYDINKIQDTITLLKNKRIENVILSGGEPLLHPHFFKILEELKSAGFSLDVCTNGTLLNIDIIRQLKKYLDEISISVDGYTKERHEKMRHVPGCFDKTMNGIKLLISEGFDVHITTVVDASFAKEIINMTDFLYVNGLRSVSYLGLIPLNTGHNNLFSPECQKLLEEQIDLVRQKYPDMSINTKQLLEKRSKCSCSAGHIVFGLGTDGKKICPCLLTRKRTEKKLEGSSVGLCPGSQYLTKKKG